MAKLYINKDIAADAEKMQYWLSGEDCMAFSDVQGCLNWVKPEDGKIEIELHSCGGDCVEGYAIYDALRASGKEISAKVVGKCASMATVIMLAAPKERRTAHQHAQFLIHSPYYPKVSGAISLESIDSIKNELVAERDKMLKVYVDRTGVDRESLEAQMKKDSWFDAGKAVELGFISSVIAPTSAKKEEPIIENMEKSKRQEVLAALKGLSAALGFGKEDTEPVAKTITTSTGDKLKVERDKGEPKVGDKASPDGTHVLEDGTTIVVTDGVITEIKEPKKEGKKAEGDDERISALEKELADMKAAKEAAEAENASLKAAALGEEDQEMLAAVRDAGGIEFLAKVTSNYVPAGRANNGAKADKKNDVDEAPKGLIQQRLAEAREKNKKK